MGKTKVKAQKSGSTETLTESQDHTLSDSRPGSALKAADGHNVDGWADDDIRTYNELLTERAKLEKEKNELEQKSSRHQTQRALLDENATALDNLFKAQMGGDFKFIGSGSCCLDFDVACGQGGHKTKFPCKHELCSRSKTRGLSWMEMDTIKYYHTRILSEKSSRMQNALRKQRDVELVRVKKDDEEEAALRARKNAILDKNTRSPPPPPVTKNDKISHAHTHTHTQDTPALDLLPAASKDFLLDPKNSAILEAAKENEHIVRRIRGRLDKIRHDVNAGRVSPADARVKLDQANSEMAEAERKNNEFRQLILDAEPTLSQLQSPPLSSSQGVATNVPASLTTVLQNTLASSNADAFTQALSVMKGFFSASDPSDVQSAITDLRGVLELNGPMSPVLQKSFKALEEMLSKPNAKGFTVDVTTGDGRTKTCNNVVEVMMNLRMKMQGTGSATTDANADLNLDQDTVKANMECIKVEDAARKDMNKLADRMMDETNEITMAALKKMKAKAVLKSPIPPLSDIVLDDVITEIMFRRSVKHLINEAKAGATLPQLFGKLTALIIASARNKPERYLAMLDAAKIYVSKSSKPHPQVLLEAMVKVEFSMEKFVAAHNEKQKKLIGSAKTIPPLPASSPTPSGTPANPMVDTKYLLEGLIIDEEELQAFREFLNTNSAKDTTSLRAHVCRYYHRNLEEGIWHMFRAVLNRYTANKFTWSDYDYEKKCYLDNLQVVSAEPQLKMLDTVLYLQELGLCPGRAAILVGQRITLQIRENFETAKSNTMVLRSLFPNVEAGQNQDWYRSFNFIAQAMTDLFAMLVFSLVGNDPIDVPIMAADILGFICTFVLGSMDAVKAETNLRYIEHLVLTTLMEVNSGSSGYKKLQDIFTRFAAMCRDSARYRCSLNHSCQERFCQFAHGKLGITVPAPLNVNKNGMSTSQAGASDTTGLSREKSMRLVAEAYWEVARQLTPHINCILTKKHCYCETKDRKFAEEMRILKHNVDVDLDVLDTMIAKNQTMPKELWDTLEKNIRLLHERPVGWDGNRERLEALRAKVGNAQSAKQIPNTTSTATDSKTAQPAISLKQVPVSVPSIQGSVSSTTSEKGNLETNQTTSASSAPVNLPPILPDTHSPSPWPMTAREAALRDQLLTFTDSVDSMHSFPTSNPPPSGMNQYALDGVAWQIEDMLIGHIEMAYLIAKAQGYSGLEDWMEYYYAQTTPLGEADDDEDDIEPLPVPESKKIEISGNGKGVASAQGKTPAPAAKGKQLQQAPVSRQADPSVLAQQASQAVADVQQLGRNFIQQMEIVSSRKKRMPKRKK